MRPLPAASSAAARCAITARARREGLEPGARGRRALGLAGRQHPRSAPAAAGRPRLRRPLARRLAHLEHRAVVRQDLVPVPSAARTAAALAIRLARSSAPRAARVCAGLAGSPRDAGGSASTRRARRSARSEPRRDQVARAPPERSVRKRREEAAQDRRQALRADALDGKPLRGDSARPQRRAPGARSTRPSRAPWTPPTRGGAYSRPPRRRRAGGAPGRRARRRAGCAPARRLRRARCPAQRNPRRGSPSPRSRRSRSRASGKRAAVASVMPEPRPSSRKRSGAGCSSSGSDRQQLLRAPRLAAGRGLRVSVHDQVAPSGHLRHHRRGLPPVGDEENPRRQGGIGRQRSGQERRRARLPQQARPTLTRPAPQRSRSRASSSVTASSARLRRRPGPPSRAPGSAAGRTEPAALRRCLPRCSRRSRGRRRARCRRSRTASRTKKRKGASHQEGGRRDAGDQGERAPEPRAPRRAAPGNAKAGRSRRRARPRSPPRSSRAPGRGGGCARQAPRRARLPAARPARKSARTAAHASSDEPSRSADMRAASTSNARQAAPAAVASASMPPRGGHLARAAGSSRADLAPPGWPEPAGRAHSAGSDQRSTPPPPASRAPPRPASRADRAVGIAQAARPTPATEPSVLAPTIQPARRAVSAGDLGAPRAAAPGSVPPSSGRRGQQACRGEQQRRNARARDLSDGQRREREQRRRGQRAGADLEQPVQPQR